MLDYNNIIMLILNKNYYMCKIYERRLKCAMCITLGIICIIVGLFILGCNIHNISDILVILLCMYEIFILFTQ